MNLLFAVLLLPLLKLATFVAVNLLRLVAALYALLVLCLGTFGLLWAVSDFLHIPMPFLQNLLRLLRTFFL
jgi:hypothetical protein